MKFHNITKLDMLNGDGLRVVLWVSGCSHKCKGCQNQITWNENEGVVFDEDAMNEIREELKLVYVDGITFSGGDPLHENNINEVFSLIKEIKEKFPIKDIWLYTGYYWEEIFEPIFTNKSKKTIENYLKYNEIRKQIISKCDVLVDGRYVESLKDIAAHWVGSSNQSVINIKKTLESGDIVLWENANTN